MLILKKILTVLLIIFLGIAFILGVSIHVLGFNYDRYKKEAQENVLLYYEKYDDLIYTSEIDKGNENLVKLVPMIHEFMDLLPEETVERFNKENWKIIISTQKPDYIKSIEDNAHYNVGGNTEHNMRIIFLYLNNSVPEYLLSDFIHEFGHYEDWEKGLIAKSKEFQDIFQKNQGYEPEDKFSDENYHLKSSREFFACCYKDYFLYSDKLEKEAPEVYNYLARVVWFGDGETKAFYNRVINYFR